MNRSEWVTSNWDENQLECLRRLGFQEGWTQCACRVIWMLKPDHTE